MNSTFRERLTKAKQDLKDTFKMLLLIPTMFAGLLAYDTMFGTAPSKVDNQNSSTAAPYPTETSNRAPQSEIAVTGILFQSGSVLRAEDDSGEILTRLLRQDGQMIVEGMVSSFPDPTLASGYRTMDPFIERFELRSDGIYRVREGESSLYAPLTISQGGSAQIKNSQWTHSKEFELQGQKHINCLTHHQSVGGSPISSIYCASDGMIYKQVGSRRWSSRVQR